MADTTLGAESAPTNPLAPARETLAQWGDFRGMKPFAELAHDAAEDRGNRLLSEACCILAMFSAAYSDADELHNKTEHSAVDAIHPRIVSGAMDGVASLISLAVFAMEAGDA